MPLPTKTARESQAAEAAPQPIQQQAAEAVSERPVLHLRTRAFIHAEGSASPLEQPQRLPVAQFPSAAVHIGRLSSNHLLSELIGRTPNLDTAVIRRAPITLQGITASTNAEAASLINMLVLRLRTEMKQVSEGDPAYDKAAEITKEGQFYVGQLSAQGEKPIEDSMSDVVTRWYGAYTSAGDAIDASQKHRASIQIQIGLADAATLASEADEARKRFDYPMEVAFRQNDNERLEKLNNGINALATAKSDVETLISTLKEIYKMIIAPGIKAKDLIVGVHPLKPIIDRAKASFSAAKAIVSLLGGGEGKTQSAKEISNVKTVVEATGAAATLLGVASGYMVGINAILPIGAALLDLVSSLLSREARTMNQFYMEQMQLDQVAWEYVPGGKACFVYMVHVMQAGDPSGVPLPMIGEVKQYFMENRESMEAGTGAEVPTSGMWWWRDIDDKKIQRWAFQNRRNLWSMLYGEVHPKGLAF
ncbi:MAG: hypothetical protein LLG44_03225 [Chloroflexi bacterium]|nr:hypothetical protein [Chloroflexota bacterium]